LKVYWNALEIENEFLQIASMFVII
jgi:hypothetical protein